MLKPELSKSTWRIRPAKFRTAQASVFALCLLVALLTLPASAFGQTYTLQMAPFYPYAVNPGGSASSNLTLVGNNFTGTVDLSCQVTPLQTTATPMCQVSPATVAPSGGATATITTDTLTGVSPPALYTITVTGTITGTATSQSVEQQLSVLAVTPQFTITVGTSVVPNSVPAGSGGQGVINVNPINGYSGTVTLSCSSIIPLVTIPPVCSFNPPAVVVNGTVQTSTITINTQGPVKTGSVARTGGFYGLWVPLPMLALMGVGAAASRKGSRRIWGLLALFVVGGAILLMPACGNSNPTSTTTPNGVTPNNTYTFAVTGVDQDGNTSSNTGSTTTANPTVSLTVTSPPPN